MSAIQPELKAQQAEIAKLAAGKEAKPDAEESERKHKEPLKYEYHGQKLPPAFPDHFAKSTEGAPAEEGQMQMKKEKQKRTGKKESAFQAELKRFMSEARPFTHPAKKVKTLPKKAEVPGKRVHGNRKAMEDYKSNP